MVLLYLLVGMISCKIFFPIVLILVWSAINHANLIRVLIEDGILSRL